jgi:hypothetical protein
MSTSPSLADQLTLAQIQAQQAQTAQAVAQQGYIETQTAQLKQQVAQATYSQYTALIPDLTKVSAGSLSASSGSPLFADVFGYEAVEHAADEVVKGIIPLVDKSSTGDPAVRMLVTNDLSLAVSESSYRELRDQLKTLNDEATDVLSSDPSATAHKAARHELLAAGVIGAGLAAIPGVLSLFSAQRTIATSDVAPDDVGLAASLIRRLQQTSETKSWKVFHDTVRLLPETSTVGEALQTLAHTRDLLVEASLAENAAADRKSAIATVLGDIGQFTTAINTVPSGASNSPLTNALLREQLDQAHPQAFTHVLVLSARAGSASGSSEHHVLGRDKFTTIGTATVSYFFFELGSRQLLRADTVTRTATGSGTIGNTLTLNLADRSAIALS